MNYDYLKVGMKLYYNQVSNINWLGCSDAYHSMPAILQVLIGGKVCNRRLVKWLLGVNCAS